MYQSPRSYQKSFSARHSEALRIIGAYRFMSPRHSPRGITSR